MNESFCQSCGARLVPGSKFCVDCGQRIGSAGRSSIRFPLERSAPFIVVGVVVLAGAAAILSGISTAKAPPAVPPRSAPSAAAASGKDMPADHPPIDLPADVREKIVQIAREAAEQPENLELWKKAAVVQYRSSQIDPKYLADAATSYNHILEREPENLEALRALGNISYDQQQPAKAVEYYDRYLKLKPGDAMVLTDLGTMYLTTKNIERAIATYQQVLATDPKFFQAQYNLAIAYRTAGDGDRALKEMERARDIAPDDVTKEQITQLLTRVNEPAPAAASAAAASDSAEKPTFRSRVEAIFRQHPIVASKIDRIEWPDDSTARVILREFPMESMPPFARDKFFSRIKDGVKEAKLANGVAQSLKIELVDSTSARVMDSITE